MLEIGIIVVVVCLVGLLVLLKLAKGIFRLISLALTLIIFAGIGLSILVVYDFYKFNEGMRNGTIAIVMADSPLNQAVFPHALASVVISPTQSRELKRLSDSEISLFDKGDYAQLSKSYFRLWVLSPELLDGTKTVNIFNTEIQQTRIKAALMSSNPSSFFPQVGFIEGLRGDDIKTLILEEFVSNYLLKDPVMIFSELKAGRLIVYPETIGFKVLKRVPTGLLSRFFKSTVDRVIEKVR